MSQLCRRRVFYVSDGTGISAEALGHALLTQFDDLETEIERIPFVDNLIAAEEAAARIDASHCQGDAQPLVFSTLVDKDIKAVIGRASAFHIDLFEKFLTPLEAELGIRSTHRIGRSHTASDSAGYSRRMDAVNFSLAHDDGAAHRELPRAEVILVGVSRSGKTPTSLYLALHYGIFAANYPLIPEDFERNTLPPVLVPERAKLVGLTVNAERLHTIRSQRRPDSRYAALENCRSELSAADRLMRRFAIPCLDATHKSIEELAAAIIQKTQVKPRLH